MRKIAKRKARKNEFFKNFYIAEFNRSVGDSIRNVARALRAQGYNVAHIRHKTTILIKRPSDKSFSEFKNDLSQLVQNRIGSMTLCSTSGRIWLLDNKGNRAGEFQRITQADFD